MYKYFKNLQKYVFFSAIGLFSVNHSLNAQIPQRLKTQIYSEVGVASKLKRELSLYRGLNLSVSSRENTFNIFGGALLDSDKKSSVTVIFSDNQKWHKYSNFSVWGRYSISMARKNINSLLEISPIKLSFTSKKLNFEFAPSAAVYNDFKNKKTAFGLNSVFQTTYSVSPKGKLFFDVDFRSNASNNLRNINFRNAINNTTYRVTYQRCF